jgi:hypothetical protein
MTANPPQRHYQPWGHDIQSPKPENTTRPNYKNTNGIGTSSLTNGLTTIYQHQKDMGVDIALYTETNTDWQQSTTKQINETYGRKIFHNAIFAYYSRATSAQQWYQPGGTMISSTGTIASGHLETGNDASGMGRYSHHKITGANGHKILFIAAYQVCKYSITSTGENTSFYHQWQHSSKPDTVTRIHDGRYWIYCLQSARGLMSAWQSMQMSPSTRATNISKNG